MYINKQTWNRHDKQKIKLVWKKNLRQGSNLRPFTDKGRLSTLDHSNLWVTQITSPNTKLILLTDQQNLGNLFSINRAISWLSYWWWGEEEGVSDLYITGQRETHNTPQATTQQLSLFWEWNDKDNNETNKHLSRSGICWDLKIGNDQCLYRKIMKIKGSCEACT